MSLSTGVDIIRIARIEKSLQRAGFLPHVYGEEELEFYLNHGEKSSFLAGNFAAKEAFAKALGTGVRGFSLREVQVLRNFLGAPYFHLSGNAEKLLNHRNISLSISHEKEYAIAFVVIEEQL